MLGYKEPQANDRDLDSRPDSAISKGVTTGNHLQSPSYCVHMCKI